MAPSPRPERKARNAYHHGNLRQALLDRAVRIIQTTGVDGLTLRGVGADLRVSRTALYRHFADKDALLAAVATEGFRAFRQALTSAWNDGGRQRAGFDAMGMSYVRFAVTNPSHYRVMFGGHVGHADPGSELAAEAQGAFQVLVDAIVEQQSAGLVRRDDPQLLAQHIWSVVHGLAMLIIDQQLPPGSPFEDLARFGIERLWTGIATA